MIRCLYVSVYVIVNGVLTEHFEVEEGVKQSCCLSAALCIIAINPLINRINTDSWITGTCVGHAHKVAAIANTDDVLL